MNKIQQDLRLLPRYFNKIAIGLITLTILFLALYVLKVINIDKELVKTLSKIGILISLLLLVLTRSKIEDERMLRIRLKAFASAFVYGATFVIVELLIHLFFNVRFSGVTELLINMFLFYFLMMFVLKKSS